MDGPIERSGARGGARDRADGQSRSVGSRPAGQVFLNPINNVEGQSATRLRRTSRNSQNSDRQSRWSPRGERIKKKRPDLGVMAALRRIAPHLFPHLLRTTVIRRRRRLSPPRPLTRWKSRRSARREGNCGYRGRGNFDERHFHVSRRGGGGIGRARILASRTVSVLHIGFSTSPPFLETLFIPRGLFINLLIEPKAGGGGGRRGGVASSVTRGEKPY